MSSILEVCQSAADELSVIRPTDVGASALDPTAQKLFRHLSRTCRDLAGRFDWQSLRREKTFTSSGVSLQANAIPADFQRFVKDTMYNRTRRVRVCGPLTPSEWQELQASVTGGIYDQFIQRGNGIYFAGTSVAGETIAYEYITKFIGVSLGTDDDPSVELAAFTQGSDTAYFDDELLISGIVWRYLKAEGRDYSEEFRGHELRFQQLTKMDGGRRVLDMTGRSSEARPGARTIGGVLGTNIEDLTTI